MRDCGSYQFLGALERFAAYVFLVDVFQPRIELTEFLHGFCHFLRRILVWLQSTVEVFIIGLHVEEAVTAKQKENGFFFPGLLAS